MQSSFTYTTRPVRFAGLENTVLRLTSEVPERLVVFVHGFRGEATQSWEQFGAGGAPEWWSRSDLLFVGYASERLDPLGVANALRTLLRDLYPRLSAEYLVAGDAQFRELDAPPYTELVLCGHSLGGVVVRKVAVDLVRATEHAASGAPTDIVDQTRMFLFSPATAGFDPTRRFGALYSLIGPKVLQMLVRHAPALRDLRPGSQLLESVKRLTETSASTHPDIGMLRPLTLWANPDTVVVAVDYDTDPPSQSVPDRTHRDICKPDSSYTAPWSLLESDALP